MLSSSHVFFSRRSASKNCLKFNNSTATVAISGTLLVKVMLTIQKRIHILLIGLTFQVRIVEDQKSGKLALCPMYPQSAACQPGLNPSAR